jgi:hypothetical protein
MIGSPVPTWMFDEEALARRSIASTTYHRRRVEFLHFRGQVVDRLLGPTTALEPRFVEHGR